MKSTIQKRQEEIEKIKQLLTQTLLIIEQLKAELSVERLQQSINEMQSKREA